MKELTIKPWRLLINEGNLSQGIPGKTILMSVELQQKKAFEYSTGPGFGIEEIVLYPPLVLIYKTLL